MLAVGKLPRNAEFKTVGTKQSSLCKFSVKVADTDAGNGKKEAKWLNCVCWHKLARYAANLEKGDTVFVCGLLKDASYTNKAGEVVRRTELECEMVIVQPEPPETPQELDITAPEDNDDDVPF